MGTVSKARRRQASRYFKNIRLYLRKSCLNNWLVNNLVASRVNQLFLFKKINLFVLFSIQRKSIHC